MSTNSFDMYASHFPLGEKTAWDWKYGRTKSGRGFRSPSKGTIQISLSFGPWRNSNVSTLLKGSIDKGQCRTSRGSASVSRLPEANPSIPI